MANLVSVLHTLESNAYSARSAVIRHGRRWVLKPSLEYQYCYDTLAVETRSATTCCEGDYGIFAIIADRKDACMPLEG